MIMKNHRLALGLLLMLSSMLCSLPAQAQKSKKKDQNKTSEYYASLGQQALKDGDVDKAESYWKEARRQKRISVDEICLGGDICKARFDEQGAEKEYRRAIYFDRHSPMGYYRLVDLYGKKRFAEGMALLDTLDQLRPDLKLTAERAQRYIDASDFASAVKLFNEMHTDTMSLSTLALYSSALYQQGDYLRSLAVADSGHALAPHDFRFNRMRLLNDDRLQRFEDAVKAGDDLFNNSTDAVKMVEDYYFYGLALLYNGRNDEACRQFDQALTMVKDPALQLRAYEGITNAFTQKKEYDLAASYYEKLIQDHEAKSETANRQHEYNELGRIYKAKYDNDSTLTSSERDAALQKAVDCFSKLTEWYPDDYVGYYNIATLKQAQDKNYTAGLAEPYYNKVINIIERKGSSNYTATDQTALYNAYRYKAYYNYLNKHYHAAYVYGEKILSVAPDDVFGQQITEAFKKYK
jgi:tetratricopeptide (TPR) repeat protein